MWSGRASTLSFNGSDSMLTGCAISFTLYKALLFTDGRYFLQAKNQLDELNDTIVVLRFWGFFWFFYLLTITCDKEHETGSPRYFRVRPDTNFIDKTYQLGRSSCSRCLGKIKKFFLGVKCGSMKELGLKLGSFYKDRHRHYTYCACTWKRIIGEKSIRSLFVPWRVSSSR